MEDIAEQPQFLFGRHPVVGIVAAVKTPASCTATFSFEKECFIEWEVMTSRKHRFLLGAGGFADARFDRPGVPQLEDWHEGCRHAFEDSTAAAGSEYPARFSLLVWSDRGEDQYDHRDF
jgi:hypothetical protein